VVQAGEVVADVPAGSLGDGPLYDRPSHKPEWLEAIGAIDVLVPPTDLGQALLAILGSPNIASKRWVYEQYDHMVMLGTVVKPGSDAAVLRIEGARSRIALTVDGNGRYCHIDPRAGSAHSVAEAARNLSALGARPVAITNCLNFGNPQRPEVMWQFKEAIAGIAQACDALGTPVTGGNVSFYNESADLAIYPTPIIGMVGILDHDVTPPVTGFAEGRIVAVVGDTLPELGGSEYARSVLGLVGGKLPTLDLAREATTGETVRSAIASGLLASVHDISSGGIGVALAECAVLGSTGVLVTPPDDLDAYLWLFSESASRYLVSFDEVHVERLRGDFAEAGCGLHVIGRTVGDRLIVEGALDLGVPELRSAYMDSFARAMSDGG
ncbi:MAG TPA: AIR synthase related protein, partial [Actinomycetota bacterium]|nr:AIR synthase related protein [Actinomycetota bacterium]